MTDRAPPDDPVSRETPPWAGVGDDAETQARLATLTRLATSWTKRINLVAASTMADFQRRHILDSAQLWPLAPRSAKSWVDLGAGGGLPGLVIAALARAHRPELRVTLVESDQRKCAFLATAAREMGVDAEILNTRIENHDGRGFDVVSARALAPLPRLLAYAAPYLAEGGVCLFPKGAAAERELTEAAPLWHSRVDRIPSASSADGIVLRMTELRPVRP